MGEGDPCLGCVASRCVWPGIFSCGGLFSGWVTAGAREEIPHLPLVWQETGPLLLVWPRLELLSLDWSGVHMVELVARERCSARESNQYTCVVQTGMRVVVSGVGVVDPWGPVPEAVPVGGRAAWRVQAGVPGKVALTHGYK